MINDIDIHKRGLRTSHQSNVVGTAIRTDSREADSKRVEEILVGRWVSGCVELTRTERGGCKRRERNYHEVTMERRVSEYSESERRKVCNLGALTLVRGEQRKVAVPPCALNAMATMCRHRACVDAHVNASDKVPCMALCNMRNEREATTIKLLSIRYI